VSTFLLYLVTALAEIVGCYLPWLWLRQGGSIWLLIPAALSLAMASFGCGGSMGCTPRPGISLETIAALLDGHTKCAMFASLWVQSRGNMMKGMS